MKKIFGIMILYLVLVFFANTLEAQPDATEPCLPDCENSQWVPAFPLPAHMITLTIGTDQNGDPINVEVAYRTRIACGMWYDVYIEMIGLDGAPYLATTNIDGYINDITLLLIVANPMNFPPQNAGDPCEDNWRVMKGGCWKYDVALSGAAPVVVDETTTVSYNFTSFWRPCNFVDCCLEYFTVCLDAQGKREITNTGFLEPSEPCDPGCTPVCGSIYR